MDCRADIKIQFEAYGKSLSRHLNINYWPGFSGVDDRVIESFIGLWAECRAAKLEEVQKPFSNSATGAIALLEEMGKWLQTHAHFSLSPELLIWQKKVDLYCRMQRHQ